ncbi:hypothetical protein G6F22_019841 [Rhizopus arrhizus]|nr:hypothetical protein G6F22_019841 [Rhizopus arrhizus]
MLRCRISGFVNGTPANLSLPTWPIRVRYPVSATIRLPCSIGRNAAEWPYRTVAAPSCPGRPATADSPPDPACPRCAGPPADDPGTSPRTPAPASAVRSSSVRPALWNSAMQSATGLPGSAG